ncbi:hypothetical protein BDV32DRAFT_120929 [Aspergillus pseudonomiae]|uniref:Uncharacterized protein n=1 Tax=Aspergillus pseudonomiae TaxID=1506151 RepID=A0A5N7DC40_9EURO|nr:uncharacterized protein BDV37DRAFT_127995 [Aspergillus pseudonomiae]KAB8262019.1 hypothetical protein BDV32DRAFT_120929 [Aspergillus pseudonomiae]KAE8403799.1 hypothetical protein BDV37DRAFT_127995 [Aspergillus pseudonomiae]
MRNSEESSPYPVTRSPPLSRDGEPVLPARAWCESRQPLTSVRGGRTSAIGIRNIGARALFEVSPWESRCEDCVCGLMPVRHFSAIRSMLYPSSLEEGMVEFDSDHSGWDGASFSSR